MFIGLFDGELQRRGKGSHMYKNFIGTHSAFREIISDFETKREKSINDAESFMKYQIAFIDAFYDQDLNALEDEYEVCL